jgi:diguanylate cyclase (GGDEF)-like protein
MNVFLAVEAKIFSVLVILVLWFFRSKNPDTLWSKLKLVYSFSAIAVLLSVCIDLFNHEGLTYAYTIIFALSGFCWCRYAFAIKHICGFVSKTVSVIAFVVFGVLAYISSRYAFNLHIYISVLAMVTMFITEQYNKIRTDNLTKLHNRYGMDEEIYEQLQQYARDKNDSFCIIACDLDNFKHINDTWGHLEGDRALILISSVLLKVSKKYDSEVFRIGGDEFVIITDTVDEEQVSDIISEIQKELGNIDFRDDFDIKMSMGMALYDGKSHITELLNSADKKLYQAKKISKTVN